MFPLKSPEKKCSLLLLASGVWAVLAVPWLTDAPPCHLSILSLCLHLTFPQCVSGLCLHSPFVIYTGLCSNYYHIKSNNVIIWTQSFFIRTLLLNVTFWDVDPEFYCIFWGDIIQPIPAEKMDLLNKDLSVLVPQYLKKESPLAENVNILVWQKSLYREEEWFIRLSWLDESDTC